MQVLTCIMCAMAVAVRKKRQQERRQAELVKAKKLARQQKQEIQEQYMAVRSGPNLTTHVLIRLS